MNIFLSFLQSKIKHAIPAYDFWQYYMKNGIEEAGYQWTEHPDIDWARGLVPQTRQELENWKSEVWEKTLNHLKKNRADLFLSYLYPEQIDIAAIRQIQKLGIPCVNFYCDNVRQFRKVPAQFGVFDLNWVPEFKAVEMYKKAGYKLINLPMPMWVAPHLRLGRKEIGQQITFIGSVDIQRTLFFEEVVKQAPDIELRIYGNGWNDKTKKSPLQAKGTSPGNKIANQFDFIFKQGTIAYMRKFNHRGIHSAISSTLTSKLQGTINFSEYNQLTAESMITVGVNRYPSYHFPLNKPNTYSRLRDIEAPMLGACYLTEYTAGLEELYDLGKEIAVYRNSEDFIEKTNHLTADASLRQKLRTAGQRRSLTEHTIPQTLSKIIDRIKSVGNR